MTEAREYIEIYQITCQRNHWFYCEPCIEYHEWLDGKPVTAVYISADDLRRARFVCADCAPYMEHGDGPIFYIRKEVI